MRENNWTSGHFRNVPIQYDPYLGLLFQYFKILCLKISLPQILDAHFP